MIIDPGGQHIKVVRAFDLADMLHEIEQNHGPVMIWPNAVGNLTIFKMGESKEKLGVYIGFIAFEGDDAPVLEIFNDEETQKVEGG